MDKTVFLIVFGIPFVLIMVGLILKEDSGWVGLLFSVIMIGGLIFLIRDPDDFS
jgi:hypothetical protein